RPSDLDEYVGYNQEENAEGEKKQKKLTSVRDSVKTLAICRKINKTLTQKQKVIVLIKLFELVCSDKNFTTQRMEIIDTVATTFNIDKEEYKLIETFVIKEGFAILEYDNRLTASQDEKDAHDSRLLQVDINGAIVFMNEPSVDM